jgi:hypothetical protein
MHSLANQFVALARPIPVAEPMVCVNCPSWLAPLSAVYAVGHEGVTLVPDYYYSATLEKAARRANVDLRWET